jgi:hypothetical protein
MWPEGSVVWDMGMYLGTKAVDCGRGDIENFIHVVGFYMFTSDILTFFHTETMVPCFISGSGNAAGVKLDTILKGLK